MDNEILIGEIDFSLNPIINETRVGIIEKIKSAKVYVYENEGKIPHFHIIIPDVEQVCVCIFTAEYFSHGTKQGTLNSSQCKNLDSFMREKTKLKDYKGMTNWEVCRSLWIQNKGSSYRGPGFESIQPDYRKLI